MNACATLGISQGHHPANHRSAIPTRVYESGSGHGHDAAPAGRPHPARAPPDRATPGNPMLSPADCPGGRPPGVKGAFGVAERALRAPGPRDTARVIWQRSRPWGQPGTPPHPPSKSSKRHITAQTRHSNSKSLTGPLHMSGQIRRFPSANPQATAPSPSGPCPVDKSQEEARALRWAHVDLDGDPAVSPPVPPHVAVWRSVRVHGETTGQRTAHGRGRLAGYRAGSPATAPPRWTRGTSERCSSASAPRRVSGTAGPRASCTPLSSA
jgi:hypothetical protein